MCDFIIRNDVPLPKKISSRTDERRKWERENYAKNRERIRAMKQDNYRNHRERELERAAKYRKENADKVRESQKKYLIKNRIKRAEVIRNYINKREASDPSFKLLRSLRARLRVALKKNSKSGSTIDLLGCSIDELKSYIESKFLPGMTWENRSRRGWHLDHVKPLASFDLSDPDELAKACHYTNLQPLWWIDNLKKGDRNGN